MDITVWEAWGRRMPFLVSIILVVISAYIRKNMAGSPLFARAKAEGKTSVDPLKESFGNQENLKKVPLALFGVTMGIGSIGWASVLFVQSAGNYFLAGLNYPLILMSASFVIGLLYLKENKGDKLIIPTSSKNWNRMKRVMGIVWILLGLAATCFGFFKPGILGITSGNQDDLIFGIIIMFFITPVAAIGLFIFGKYSLQGEYDE